MGKVTIKDVAREAGVSISTVSNALNDVNVLHPDTKAHILEVAKRLNYTPNLNGRNLKARATKSIGLFAGFMGGPYMGALMYSMASACREEGYELNVFVTGQETSVMANLLGRRVDGAVILSSRLSKVQETELAAAGIPIVYLNQEAEGNCLSSVNFESYEAGRMAGEYLLQKGYTDLGVIEGPDNYDATERSRGFQDVLGEHGIALNSEFVLQGGFAREVTTEAVLDFLKQHPDAAALPEAVFAVNDLSAIGCMEAFKQAGIAVPGQVAVLGCDDIELSAYLQPALSTIRTNFEEQGTAAVKSLLSMLKGEHRGETVQLSCKLIPRESA